MSGQHIPWGTQEGKSANARARRPEEDYGLADPAVASTMSAAGVMTLQRLLGNQRTAELLVQRAKPNKTQAQTLASGGYVSKRPYEGLAKGERAGGFYFGNKEGRLPRSGPRGRIRYTEYDVNAYNGVNRGAERVVRGSDGRLWYTNDHYNTFTQIT